MKFYNQVIMVPRDKIKPNPWNPNEMDADTHASLGNTLDQYGMFGGILCQHVFPGRRKAGDDFWRIVDGEQRYRELLLTTEPLFPVIEWEGTDDEAKTLTIALNALRGGNDVTKMAALVSSLPDPSVLIKYAGLSPAYIANFTAGVDWQKILDGANAGGEGEARAAADSKGALIAHVNFLFTLPRSEAQKFRAALDGLKAEHGVTEDEQAIMLLVSKQVSPPQKDWGYLSFLVHASQQGVINQAIDAIAAEVGGKNARGRALEYMAGDYLASSSAPRKIPIRR